MINNRIIKILNAGKAAVFDSVNKSNRYIVFYKIITLYFQLLL